MLERSKGRRQTKRDPPLPCGEEGFTKAKGDNPTENSLLEGFRWQLHHQAPVLWADNLHSLNHTIIETSTERNQTDSRPTNFGMKRITKIGIWYVRTLRESGRLRQAVACIKSYGLNILGLSEVRST
jgi:hypothetical protein